MTDNGPQFSSAEFVTFTKVWSFEHSTSSPHYPQSNGKAENAVKTVKRLFTKCKEAGQSEYRALLDWRNTPTEGLGTSPTQRFLGHRCRTILPMTHSQLEPRYPTMNTPPANGEAGGAKEQLTDTLRPSETKILTDSVAPTPVEQEPCTPQPLHRSGRTRKSPDWITNYVPS